MTTQTFQPDAYKAKQQQEWDGVSQAWQNWWTTFEKFAQHVSDHLINMANIQSGDCVLDVATGIGEPAMTVAKFVGPRGKVIATDQSPKMLAIARSRAEAANLTNISFTQVDGENLEFHGDLINAAVCRWGLMFMPNPVAMLNQIHRLLSPGASFATAIWGPPEKVPALSLPMSIIKQRLDPPPPPPEAPTMFKLAAPGLLGQVFTEANFIDYRTESLIVDFHFSSPEEYIRFLKEVAAPITALLASEQPDVQTEIWEAIADEARAFSNADGSVTLPSETVCAVGVRG